MSEYEKSPPPILITDPSVIFSEARRIGIDLGPGVEPDPYEPSDLLCAEVRSLMRILEAIDVEDRSTYSLPEDWVPDDAVQNLIEIQDGLIIGETRIFRNAMWSSEFVHSSDLMLPLGILAEKLMNEGDVITSIDKFRIFKHIRREMIILGGKNVRSKDLEGKYEGSPSFSAELKTAHGEEIAIAGFEKGDMIPVRSVNNALLSEIIYNFSRRTISENGIALPMAPIPISKEEMDIASELPSSAALSMAIDVVIRGSMQIPGRMFYRLSANFSQGGLVGGFEDFKTPSMDDLLNGGSLTLEMPSKDSVKPTKTGYVIVPISFQFNNADGSSVGGGIFNLAALNLDYGYCF